MLNDDSPYYWFVLRTKSRAEKTVFKDLLEKGIEVYLPLRKELKQWSDRKKWVESPVIRSYIFIHIQMKDYRRVFESDGVVRYVSHDGKAAVIPDREIETMRRMIESNISFNVETNAIQIGQVITVESGPLKGITGEVVDIQGDRKLFLRISHIGYTLVANLDDETTKK